MLVSHRRDQRRHADEERARQRAVPEQEIRPVRKRRDAEVLHKVWRASHTQLIRGTFQKLEKPLEKSQSHV